MSRILGLCILLCCSGFFSVFIPPYIPLYEYCAVTGLVLIIRILANKLSVQISCLLILSILFSYFIRDKDILLETLGVVAIILNNNLSVLIMLTLLGLGSFSTAAFIGILICYFKWPKLRVYIKGGAGVGLVALLGYILYQNGLDPLLKFTLGKEFNLFTQIVFNLSIISALILLAAIQKKDLVKAVLGLFLTKTGVVFFLLKPRRFKAEVYPLGALILSLAVLVHSSRNLPRAQVRGDGEYFIQQIKVDVPIDFTEFCKDKHSVWINGHRVCFNSEPFEKPETLGGYPYVSARGIKKSDKN